MKKAKKLAKKAVKKTGKRVSKSSPAKKSAAAKKAARSRKVTRQKHQGDFVVIPQPTARSKPRTAETVHDLMKERLNQQ